MLRRVLSTEQAAASLHAALLLKGCALLYLSLTKSRRQACRHVSPDMCEHFVSTILRNCCCWLLLAEVPAVDVAALAWILVLSF